MKITSNLVGYKTNDKSSPAKYRIAAPDINGIKNSIKNRTSSTEGFHR